MNQMQNGEIKPRRALKTTQLCELPAAVQGAPADAARRDSEPSGDFSAPPGRIVWLPAPEGKFHPSSRGLGCRVGERNPICFQSGSSLPCTARSSSPRCERPAGAPLRLFFFPLLQMHVAFCAPRPLLQAVPQPAAQPRIPQRPLLSNSERSKNSKISLRYEKKKTKNSVWGLGRKEKKKEGGEERNVDVVVVVSFVFGGFVRFQLFGMIGERNKQSVLSMRAERRCAMGAARSDRTERCRATSDGNRSVPGRESLLSADGRAQREQMRAIAARGGSVLIFAPLKAPGAQSCAPPEPRGLRRTAAGRNRRAGRGTARPAGTAAPEGSPARGPPARGLPPRSAPLPGPAPAPPRPSARAARGVAAPDGSEGVEGRRPLR